MAIISCPICAKDVSAQAPACPNCGHPIAEQSVRKQSQPIMIEKRTSWAWMILLILLILIGFAAAVTKPGESALKNALIEKYPLIYDIGFVEEKIGLGKMKYHDYFIISTFSVDLIGEPEPKIANTAIPIINQPTLSDEQMRQGFQKESELLKNEMQRKANNKFAWKHPASTIESPCELPVINS